jgi:amidase
MESIGERMPAVRGQVMEIMTNADVRALVFLTMPCPASVRHDAKDPTYECSIDDPYRPCYLASTTGFPEVTVPAGFTKTDEMPIGLSFFGRPFAEETLIGLAFAYEQASRARRAPKDTPPLPNRAE